MPIHKLSVVGLMSGSSLDGVDLAWCDFVFDTETDPVLQSWSIRTGTTVEYPVEMVERLRQAPELDGRELWLLHTQLGLHFGEVIKVFLKQFEEKPDLIASHGHTVFHYPEQQTTTQIGDGAAIAGSLQMIVVDQFRTLDMALGGQGAPLAPLADYYFFRDYFACLNLGGIANLSVQTPKGYLAFDNGGANQVLDALCQEIGLSYDDNGQLARSGQLIPILLEEANKLPYFAKDYPKSLGNDWVRDQMLPLFQHSNYPVADRLHTCCVQIARQIGQDLQGVIEKEGLQLPADAKMLAAGGGGFNSFLCECIAEAIAPVELLIAEPDITAYKEAAMIALAGGLRILKLPNVLPTVTGARRAAVGGAIHYGK